MITEWLVSIGTSVAVWFVGLFPELPEDTMDGATLGISTLAGLVGSMSVWVNWLAVIAQVTLVMGFYFAFLAVKVLRQLFAHVPFFGGSG